MDKRADIWAFGVIVYEMLTGEQQFAGDSVTDVLASVVRQDPDLTRVPAKIRPPLERCLAKDPKVPDLFLAAHRDCHVSGGHRHEHLMIEIKRPTQKVNSKLVAQGESYASVLNACSEFDPTRTKWDLFLVSGEIDDNVVNLKRRKNDRAFGHIDTMGNVRLWAFTWGEIIEAARDEMRIVRDKLEMKAWSS